MKVGTICKLKVACLSEEAGTLGVVFNDYDDGFQVIFEHSNYDGFSRQHRMGGSGRNPMVDMSEVEAFLEEVGFEESLAGYQFKNVMQVSEDYRKGLFNVAWSEKWQGEAKMDMGIGDPTKTTERTCLICGCTDSQACEGGCNWIDGLACREDICSKCITEQVPECINLLILLIEALLPTHPDRIYHQHYEDGTCSTSDLIEYARKVEKALRQ